MRITGPAAFAAAVLVVLVPARLPAQIDYRNLDDDRPTLVEDAYAIERYAFELLLPHAITTHRGGARTHATVLELAYGVASGAHLGLKVPLAGAEGSSGRVWGLAGIRGFLLYNANTEGPALPALSLRLDGFLPAGPLGGNAVRGEAKLIATRSLGGLHRIHLNAAVGLGPDGTPPAAEGAARWWYGAAVDRVFWRSNLLLIGEIYARRDERAAPVEVNAGLGVRWQWTPTLVVDLGLSRRLRANGPDLGVTFGLSHAFALRGLMPAARNAAPAAGGPGASRQERRLEQFYYPGEFNWQFLGRYPEAARLFNAFDYGHATLYEQLYDHPDSAAAARALAREYRYLTTDLLIRPPRFAVVEEAVMPSYARLAWRAKMMFDWAHALHRQIYDVYADERLTVTEKQAMVERLTDYYLSNRRLAFASVPKSMVLMDEQYYSMVFRRRHPEFNGLIWAYHWLQVGLYEPLIAGTTPDERKSGIDAAIARFWQMLRDPPSGMPRVMPMTPTVAPVFSALHPRAAAIFDNLHMMHDIISDVLAADTVPRERKRAVIYAALDELQHPSSNVITLEAWRAMGDHMGGIDAMGGPATGLLRAPVTRAPAQPRHEHDE